MIVVRLMGGLGNQFFQYAAGRAVAHRHSVELQLDLRWFRRQSSRQFMLDRYRVAARPVTEDVARELPPARASRFPLSMPPLNPRRRRYTIIRERSFEYDGMIETAPSDAYLAGYWQSERYFSEIRPLLLDELQPVAEPSSATAELLARIAETPTVAVHVRRGDYVTNRRTQTFHGLCSPDYYARAMSLMDTRLSNPTYLVFSDDIRWCKSHFTHDRMAFVDHTSPSAAGEDLRLMSACAGHIIANSSFSWWGAWLAFNGANVVAPIAWFEDRSIDARDVVPDRWIRL